MVYLDSAATTPLDPEVLTAMQPYFGDLFGNASSVHTFGRAARMAVERARQQIADVLHAKQSEILFTSSASEANNLAIKGVIESAREKFPDRLLEIVVSPIEHPCVMESLRHIEKLGWAKLVWLPVDQHGIVSLSAVQAALTPDTVLVSVMYVNNEIGSLQPIQEIGSLIKKIRKSRLDSLPLYFHSDAVQAVQYFDCNVATLGVDLLTATAHKLYGPQGVGVLYLRDGVSIARQIDGGGQEYYRRAGTENVAGIVGAGEAFARLAPLRDSELRRLTALRDRLTALVLETIPDCVLTGNPVLRAPHIASFLFAQTDAEALIIALDRAGYAVSSGSACSSGVVRQSHVLEALLLPEGLLKQGAAVRISLGRTTTPEEIADFVTALSVAITDVRSMRF